MALDLISCQGTGLALLPSDVVEEGEVLVHLPPARQSRSRRSFLAEGRARGTALEAIWGPASHSASLEHEARGGAGAERE